MTDAIGSWLAEVYLLSTAVLLAACGALRFLRQPARRLFVARCAAVGIVGLIGVSIWSSGPGIADHSSRLVEEVAPPRPPPTDPGPLRDAGPDLPPTNRVAIGCDVTPPASFPVLGCPDEDESPPLQSLAGCEPVAIVEGPSRSTFPTATMPESPPEPWSIARGVTLAFLVGFGVTTVWLLAGARAAARLPSRTIEAPQELRAKLSGVVGGSRRAPRLRIGPGVRQPFVIGVRRPTIVLPTRFADEGEPEGRVEAALRHEWAHVRNGDLVLLAILRGLLPILFAHPAYWWLRRQVRADQETMADALAVGDGDRLGYAEALLSWARATPDGIARSHAGALRSGTGPPNFGSGSRSAGPPVPVGTPLPTPMATSGRFDRRGRGPSPRRALDGRRGGGGGGAAPQLRRLRGTRAGPRDHRLLLSIGCGVGPGCRVVRNGLLTWLMEDAARSSRLFVSRDASSSP